MKNDALRRLAAAFALSVAACSRGSDDAAAGDAEDSTRAPLAVAAASAESPTVQPVFRSGSLMVHDVVAPAPVPTGDGVPPMAIYFTIMNEGAEADTLDGIKASAGVASLHAQRPGGGGRLEMAPLEHVSIPAGETIRFLPGGMHVMVEAYSAPPAAGDTFPLTLQFRHSGAIAVSARVVTYAALEGMLFASDAHANH